MKILAIALLLICSPAVAHTPRTDEAFTFTTTETPVEAGVAAPAPGVRVTRFNTDLEYGDGHRESAAGHCSVSKSPPGAAFDESGVCGAPGAYTLEVHCQPAPGKVGSNCWGSLTGALDGRHNGLGGLVTYQRTPEGETGVGRWN